MSREKKLIKDTFIYAFGNLFSKLISFLLLPLYTGYLTVSDYGFWDIVTTTTMLIIPIIIFQLNEGIYRHLIETDSIEKKKSIITTALYVVIRNLVIFTTIYLFVFVSIDLKYKFLVLIYIFMASIYEVILQITRGLKKNIIYSLAGIIYTSITLTLNIIFIKYLDLGLRSMFISIILANIITLIFVLLNIKLIKFIRIKSYNIKIKGELIKYSIPLIPNVISWWIMNLSDRYMINYNLGIEANGIYAISNKIPTILFLTNSIFYMAWQESAILSFESLDRNEYYTKMFNGYMKFLLSSAILLLAFTKLAFVIMIDTKFFEAINYVPFLYLGTVFSAFSSFYGTGYHSSKDTRGAFTTSIFGAMVNVLINLIFISTIGIQAASLSTMLAFLIMWLVRIKQTKKYFNIRIDIKSFWSLIIIFIIIQILLKLSNRNINYICILIALVVFLITNKSFLYKILNKISSKLSRTSSSQKHPGRF